MNQLAGKTIVVALGGNAIARAGDDGSIDSQYARALEAVSPIAELVCEGVNVVLTHGNGPVIGHIVLRGELASAQVPPMPLFIAGADSEGGIGLMLQQTLGNELRARGCAKVVATVVTQVVVDSSDPAFRRPTKPIGSSYSAEDAAALATQRGWTLAPQPDGRHRRVVASPLPEEIVEIDAIRAIIAEGFIPIAAGGGGVPVVRRADGSYAGIDAVIDKDWSSALLARCLGADGLAIVMEAESVFADWGTSDARALRELTVEEAEVMAERADEGSIGPKIGAAASFVRHTGRTAWLCGSENLVAALSGQAGTLIRPV